MKTVINNEREITVDEIDALIASLTENIQNK